MPAMGCKARGSREPRRFRLFVTIVAACPLGMTYAAEQRVEANRVAEFSFESVRDLADPFGSIRLDAVFTTPDGRLLRVPAFWAGGRTWRVRYASPVVGAHRFVTESSDPDDNGLHGRSGSVVVTPSTSTNPLHVHGPIGVAADRRHFAHEDGTPFFWLGDTWWMGLVARLEWPASFEALADDRRDKGFTVVQIVAGLYPDMPAFDDRGLGDAGFPWERGYVRIRPEYFDAADRRINALVERGLVPCILGGWGYHLPWLGTEKMGQHWRYLIARWGALPVVWCAAGEQAMPWYLSGDKAHESEVLRREWTTVIEGMRRTNPFGRLITTHPRRSARDEILFPELVDFEMQQTGHRRPTAHHAAEALREWNRPPRMPVISGESRYEALVTRGRTLSAKQAREAFWAHLLNSGCAGHTYGATGIWQVNLPDRPFGSSPHGGNWGDTPWQEAMALPGAEQIARGKRLLLTLPWTEFAPRPELVAGATSAAGTADGRCVVAFVVDRDTVSIDAARLAGAMAARWFDPVSGTARPATESPLAAEGSGEIAAPGPNAAGDGDWVLVLEQADEHGRSKPNTEF